MASYSTCGNVMYPFNHGLSPIMDDKGYVVKPTNASYAYWSASDGSIPCPNWKFQSYHTKEVYWIVCILFIVLRGYITALQLKIASFLFIKRRNDNKANGVATGNSSSRKHGLCFGLPLTTIFEICHTLTFIIMIFALGLLENVNPVYMFLGFVVSIEYIMVGLGLSCLKIVQLGQRILPKAFRGDKMMDNSILHDIPLLFLFLVFIVSNFLTVILVIFLAPSTGDIRYSYYGIFFIGITTQTGALILARQGSRVINYMIESNNLVKSNIDVNENDGDTTRAMASRRVNQIKQVIFRMRVRSFVLVLAGTPNAIIAILAGGGIIPFYWYIMLIFAYGGAVSSFSSLIMFVPRGMSLIPCIPSKVEHESDQPNQNKEGENVSDPSSNKANTLSLKHNQVAVASSPTDLS